MVVENTAFPRFKALIAAAPRNYEDKLFLLAALSAHRRRRV